MIKNRQDSLTRSRKLSSGYRLFACDLSKRGIELRKKSLLTGRHDVRTGEHE